jgi:hypothetical protein
MERNADAGRPVGGAEVELNEPAPEWRRTRRAGGPEIDEEQTVQPTCEVRGKEGAVER